MSDVMMFQPAWNSGIPRRQFRHLQRMGVFSKTGGDLPTTNVSLEGASTGAFLAGESSKHHEGGSWVHRLTLRSKCTCLECGHEFGIQREGAMYLCEHCVSAAGV